MSRNVNEVRDAVFQILRDNISPDDECRIVNVKRHINLEDKDKQLDFIIRAKINYFEYCGLSIVLFLYSENFYIFTPREYKLKIEDLGICEAADVPVETAAGLLSASQGYLTLKHESKSLVLIDKCFGVSDESDTENVSFSASSILDFFCDYALFVVNGFEVKYKEDIDRFFALLLCENCIAFDSRETSYIINLLLLKSSRSIAKSIVNCFGSNFLDYVYLQLYQCLEYLFLIVSSKKMSLEHTINIEKTIDIVATYPLRIGESENLQHVLHMFTPEADIITFYNNFYKEKEDDISIVLSKVTQLIYKTRCEVAHLRYNQKQNKSNEFWVNIIRSLTQIVYKTFEAADNEIQALCIVKNVWEELE